MMLQWLHARQFKFHSNDIYMALYIDSVSMMRYLLETLQVGPGEGSIGALRDLFVAIAHGGALPDVLRVAREWIVAKHRPPPRIGCQNALIGFGRAIKHNKQWTPELVQEYVHCVHDLCVPVNTPRAVLEGDQLIHEWAMDYVLRLHKPVLSILDAEMARTGDSSAVFAKFLVGLTDPGHVIAEEDEAYHTLGPLGDAELAAFVRAHPALELGKEHLLALVDHVPGEHSKTRAALVEIEVLYSA